MNENYEKLNIENIDTIDSLAYDKDTFKLILLLSDGMDWHDEGKHLLLLQEKLNSYLLYIDTKQYEDKYPEVKKVEIQVSFLFKEPEICHYLLDRAKAVLTDNFQNVEMIIKHGTESSD